MEKYRFYLDLPGDFWESGTLLRYLREREVQVYWACLCRIAGLRGLAGTAAGSCAFFSACV